MTNLNRPIRGQNRKKTHQRENHQYLPESDSVSKGGQKSATSKPTNQRTESKKPHQRENHQYLPDSDSISKGGQKSAISKPTNQRTG